MQIASQSRFGKFSHRKLRALRRNPKEARRLLLHFSVPSASSLSGSLLRAKKESYLHRLEHRNRFDRGLASFEMQRTLEQRGRLFLSGSEQTDPANASYNPGNLAYRQLY